jgi:hypothetical protein
MDTVAMASSVDALPRSVDRVMDHVCSGIQKSAFTTIDHFTILVHSNQIGPLDHGESDAEWIDPERICFNWVLHLH